MLYHSYKNYFDYVIEQTCFCAIHPSKRLEYERLVHTLLNTNGKLIGLWFPLDKDIKDGGPPYGTTIDEVKTIFALVLIQELMTFIEQITLLV